MKDIVHIRIDDRLLHGQVVTFWSNSLNVNRIMVANDEVANDEMQKSVLRMVAPAGMRTSIITKEKAANNILANKYDGQRVLLIVKNPGDILELMNKGLDIKHVNVGNMAKREGTTQVKRSVSVTEDEIKQFYELDRRGVKLTSIMVPDEAESFIMDFLKKAQK